MSLERFTRKEMAVVAPDQPAAVVAELMRTRHVGAVVVVEVGRPVGIVTDRDLALQIVAASREARTPVSEVMSRPLITLRVDQQIDDAAVRMREHGVRRLPIVDGQGKLVGIVSLDDLYVLLAGELSTTARAVIDNRGP